LLRLLSRRKLLVEELGRLFARAMETGRKRRELLGLESV
jgi:hypothetical protein